MNERLKGLIQLVFVGILVYFLISWLTDDTCRLSGCDNKGIGWQYCPQVGGPCKPKGYGGFCSREHVNKYEREKYE